MRPRTVSEIATWEYILALVTGLAGVVNGGIISVLAEPALLDVTGFWELYVVSGLAAAAVFPVLVVRLTNPVSESVIAVTRTSDALASFMADLVDEFGLASVTTPLGIGLGIGLWLVFGAVVIPVVLTALGQGALFTVPHFGLGLLTGYFFYGLSLGGFYGLAAPELQRRRVRSEVPAAS